MLYLEGRLKINTHRSVLSCKIYLLFYFNVGKIQVSYKLKDTIAGAIA